MVLSFDLDGVVMHSAMELGVFRRIDREVAEFLQARDGGSETEALEKAWVHLREISWQHIRSGRSVDAFDWVHIVQEVQHRLGMPGSLDVTVLLQEALDAGIGHTEPGALEVLQYYKDSAAHLIAITNGLASYQMPCLEALALRQYFEEVYTVDRSGFAKPEPGAFAVGWNEEPVRIHVGDRVVEDVAGARLAGWQAVWYAPHLQESWGNVDPLQRPEQFRIEDTEDFAVSEHRRQLYNITPEQLRPDAVVVHLDELPATTAALERRFNEK